MLEIEKSFYDEGSKLLFEICSGILKWAGTKIKHVDAIEKASQKYLRTYVERYGHIKVLGMSEPIPLEDIYTDVQFVGTEHLRKLSTPEALLQAMRERGKRGFAAEDAKRQDGLSVANKRQYLNVLGQPGAGKTTFLRRIGLEALRPEESVLDRDLLKWGTKIGRRYEHKCVPVFIELRTLKDQKLDLLAAVEREFDVCGFPTQFGGTALRKGSALLLLDGIDEVPAENTIAVIDAIRDFVDHYQANRFIISCRTAFYRSWFARFTDVTLPEFNGAQIETFVKNWFRCVEDVRNKTAETFLKSIRAPENQATFELATTPLLLTFLCLMYDSTQGLPANRSDLYEEALKILLDKWAAEKRIRREAIYQGLNTKIEILLLQEIAGPAFVEDKVFFREDELVRSIDSFFQNELNAPKHLDGAKILQAIEIQQGLFVQRARNIYSFSHFTLHEYLAAKYFTERDMARLTTDYLFDPRWHEIFLLIAGMGRADDLLDRCLMLVKKNYNEFDEVICLFEWAKRNVNEAKTPEHTAAKRAVAVLATQVFAIESPLITHGYMFNRVSTLVRYLLSETPQTQHASQLQEIITFISYVWLPAIRISALGIDFNSEESVSQVAQAGFGNHFIYIRDFAETRYIGFHRNHMLDVDLGRWFLRLCSLADLFPKPNIEAATRVCDARAQDKIKTSLDFATLTREFVEAFQIPPTCTVLADGQAEALFDAYYGFLLLAEVKTSALSVTASSWRQITAAMFTA
jgi:hypothetical protein